MNVGDKLSESDFASLTPDGQFVQMKYIEEALVKPFIIKHGLFTIQKKGGEFYLKPTEFIEDRILDTFVHTEDISNKINCFFNKLDIYKKYGFEVPKRAILLYGPAGTGKSTLINKVSKQYLKDESVAVIIWPTDKYEAYEVKDFLKTFDYKDIKKLIFIIEDIGGVEVDAVRMKSDSSLLSLLDNQEKTFKIPTLILATTNFPANFLGNLTNRPQRFDDKIEVDYPPKEYRVKLLEFFLEKPLDDEVRSIIESIKCKDFTPAHIKEIVIRSEIYDKTILEVINEMIKEIEIYNKAFSKQKSMGFSGF